MDQQTRTQNKKRRCSFHANDYTNPPAALGDEPLPPRRCPAENAVLRERGGFKGCGKTPSGGRPGIYPRYKWHEMNVAFRP